MKILILKKLITQKIVAIFKYFIHGDYRASFAALNAANPKSLTKLVSELKTFL